MTSCLLAVAFAMLLFAVPVRADQAWHFYAGGLGTRWHGTPDARGHDEDCRSRTCDARDFATGNLDSSIGYRLGFERDWELNPHLSLVAGADLSLVSTEYNRSQRDIWLLSVSPFVGAKVGRPAVTASIRSGLSPGSTDDGRWALGWFAEGVFDFPVSTPSSIRMAVRRTNYDGYALRDAFLGVVLGDALPGKSPWRYQFSAGMSQPGAIGKGYRLSRAPLWRHALERGRRSGSARFEYAWTSTAHESSERSSFRGVPGNRRGITVPTAGIFWASDLKTWRTSTLGYRIGGELAQWNDEHRLLVRTSGAAVRRDLDVAATLGTTMKIPIDNRADVFASVEYAYWTGLQLDELRTMFGIRSRL